MSVRLYIGNLPEEVDRQALETLFTSAGEVISTKVIRDRKTGKCRGFGFLTVSSPELADHYIEKFNGYTFGESTLKIEVAQPRGKGEGEEGDGPSSEREISPRANDAEPASQPNTKKRTRGANRSGASSSSTPSTATASGQPDPRWASQLQRIKEQLQATSQP